MLIAFIELIEFIEFVEFIGFIELIEIQFFFLPPSSLVTVRRAS